MLVTAGVIAVLVLLARSPVQELRDKAEPGETGSGLICHKTHAIFPGRLRSFERLPTENVMKFLLATAALSISATLAGAAPGSEAPEGNRRLNCTARVLQSEELPFAPEGQWLVNVTLEITPPRGRAYLTTLHYRMPWQGPPPRRGQVFRLLCDPANQTDLHLIGLGRMD